MRKRRWPPLLGAILVVMSVTMPSSQTWAGESDLWANGSPYVTTLAHAYLADPVTVITVGQSMHDPLDVHAVLYLSSHSDKRALDLWKRRLQNATYAQLLADTGVSVDSLFTPCGKAVVPPPLARAYRLLAEHRKNPAHPLDLYNEEIMNLIALKFCVDSMGLTASDVFALLDKREPMQAIVRTVIEANPFIASQEAPHPVTFNGAVVKRVPYFSGEPHCDLAVYSPHKAGSVSCVNDGVYLMGLLRVKGVYAEGVARPSGFETAELRTVPWFRNMCSRYFPACKGQGWVGTAPPNL